MPLFFLRRLLIYLCEPGCLKDCMPGLEVLLDYVWPDYWVIGMTFYFCRTLPFVLHSLLRRLAKTGMLNTLGLFWLVHTLDTRGIDSGLFRQEFFCFPFHLCWNWFDWYGVLLLLGATIFVFALTLSQISWGEMLQLFFLRCADLFLCTWTFEGLPTRCWAGSDGLVWLIVLRDYFLPGETTVGLFFLYTWAHLYWSPKFLWPCVALEENSTVPGTRVPLDYLHLNDRYDSAFAGLFPFCFVLTLVCISWKRMLLVVCLTCLSFLLSLFICVWSCTWKSAKVCCHRFLSHQFDRTFCVALTDQEHMFTKDIRAGGAILCPIVLGWKLCLSALISFVCARDPRCFSDLITGVGQCRTFFPWTGFNCRLIWWLVLLPEVLVFSVIALYALHLLVWAQGLSYLPSICSERYCGMLTAPVFVSPWFYSRLLFLLCQYENTSAHAFPCF